MVGKASLEFSKNAFGEEIVVLSVRGPSSVANVEVFLFGAHVSRWFETGKPEFLFLSEKASLDGSKAIRGGIPIIFPQFGGMGNLVKHGFARTSLWAVSGEEIQDGENAFAEVSLKLVSSEKTRAFWDKDFEMEYSIRLVGSVESVLEIRWSVKNTGAEPFAFTDALHTYFSVKDISQTKVQDLAGLHYLDNLQKQKRVEFNEKTLLFDREVDRIYMKTPDKLEIHDSGNSRRFIVSKSAGLPDAVVWNPWIEKSKAMEDFGDDEYKKMVCVEAGAISNPIELCGGQEYTAHMTLSVEGSDESSSKAE